MSLLEIRKAANTLAPKKAPGPVGLPMEIYRHLPALHETLSWLFTLILRKGQLPKEMLKLFIIPLGKSGKPRTSCDAKRPISLICAISKLLELVVLNRIQPFIEPRLHSSQFAYGRSDEGRTKHHNTP